MRTDTVAPSSVQRRRAVRRPRWLGRLWPPTSLRMRIFLAMLAGALVVYVAAGIAVLNRISADFDVRIEMQSSSAGQLAAQFYDQQEEQLAAFARLVAAMPSIKGAVVVPDITVLATLRDRLKTNTDLSDATDGYLIYDRYGHLLYDGFGPLPTTQPPLTVQAVLGGQSSGQGIENIDGMPSLIGAAPINDDSGGIAAAVAIVEPLSSQLMARTQQQTGYPCSVFDAGGHLLAASEQEAWPTVPPRPRATMLAAGASQGAKAGQRVSMPNNIADIYLLPLFNPRGDLAGTVALYQPTGAVRQLQWNVQSLFMALLLAGFLVSATIAWLFARVIMRPIQQLARAADEIAGGEYDHPVSVRGADEIGRLAQNFERMRRRVRDTTGALILEKRRSEAEATVVNAVLNATNDGIIMLDAQGRFRMANRRWEVMFGIEAATLTSLSAEELRARLRAGMDDADAFDDASLALQRDPERVVLAEEFSQCWPEPRRVRRFSAPVRAQDGEIIGRVFVYQDISRERQADELKQALLSTVSHELRTPLTTIKGYARTLLLDEWDPETRRDFLRIVDEEADKLSELVDNLLDLSKIEAGVLQIHRQPVLLCPLLAKVAQRRIETSASHRFVTDCPAALPLVEGDPRRLEQVLENLIENARKYSAGGTITIRATSDGATVEISVSDEGQGIPQDLRERVFERFFQVDNSLSRGTGGTGLGLSICRGLIEAHGGRIWVKQSSPRGTTIAFTLPVMRADDQVADDEAGPRVRAVGIA